VVNVYLPGLCQFKKVPTIGFSDRNTKSVNPAIQNIGLDYEKDD